MKNGRFSLVNILAVIVSFSFIGQMLYIQNSDLGKRAYENGLQYAKGWVTVYPARGSIYDRWGNLLAGNEIVYEVSVDLNLVSQGGNPETIATVASEVLGMGREMVLKIASTKMDKDHMGMVLMENVGQTTVDQLDQRKKDLAKTAAYKEPNGDYASLVGLIWTPYLKRTYPEGKLASNVLGYENFLDRQKGKGTYGLEQEYDIDLTGTPQQRLVTSNPYLIGDIIPVPAGATLILTIDRAIQASLETSLDKALEDSGAEAGTILVLDPKTGEILGMASAPRFDPRIYWKEDLVNIFSMPYFNRAVSDTYEPGSVFKVITMAAALDARVVKPDTIFHDTGQVEVDGVYFYNWNGGAYGDQTMIGCLQHSLNVCLVNVALWLGPTRFYSYLKDFGIGQKSSVDLAAESVQPLRLPVDTNWDRTVLATNAFGQGLAIAPIQLAAAISAVANDGKMMVPHILRSMIVNGRQYDTPLQVARSPIRPETARTLTEMLATSLVNEASTALVPGYRMAGKTGTAEIADAYGQYSLKVTNASFVGWGPADDPRFLVYIWLEKPTKSIWGSEVAAPVFSEVATNLVVLMNIPPDEKRLQLNGK